MQLDQPLHAGETYSDSIPHRAWLYIQRYLHLDYDNVQIIAHPSGGYRLYANVAEGDAPTRDAHCICSYTILQPKNSLPLVYLDAPGDSPVWTYVALLDAVLEGEHNMRKAP